MSDGLKNEVDTEFTVTDKASRPALAIANSFKRVAGAALSISTAMAGVGGLVGIFQIGQTIAGLDETYARIKRIRGVTGLAAEEAHSIVDAFGKSGIEGGVAESVIMRMTRRASELVGQIENGGGKTNDMAAAFKKLGINIKAGPRDMLLQMADATAKGKMGINHFSKMFALPLQQATQMVSMMKKGRGEISKMMDDAHKDVGVIDEQALANYNAMKKAKAEIGNSWESIVGTIYKSVMPAVATLMKSVAKFMDGWHEKAEKFGSYLADNMDRIVGAAKTLLKIMVMNKALMLTTGEGLGKWLGKGAGYVRGKVGGGIGAQAVSAGINGFGGRAAGWVGKAAGMFGGPGAGAVAGNMASKAAGLLGGPGVSSALSVVLRIIGGIARLAGLGAIITLVLATIRVIMKNVDGVTTRMKALIGSILNSLSALWDGIMSLFGEGTVLGDIFDGLGSMIAETMVVVLDVIDQVLKGVRVSFKVIKWIIDDAKDGFSYTRARGISGMWGDAERIVAAEDQRRAKNAAMAKAKSMATPDARSAPPNFDFRGSKFDIKQNFAEGFDPDRIAVAFANDLAGLADRRVQSGLAPLFSAR